MFRQPSLEPRLVEAMARSDRPRAAVLNLPAAVFL
jgi:hypothetical protein